MSREPSSRGQTPAPRGAFEHRLGRALGALLAERRRDPEVVEARLGIPRGAVARLVRGDGDVDLATLQRVLLALDVDPGEFLAGLYAGPDEEADPDAVEAAPAAAAGLDREGIEALLARITTTVRGLVRILDARAAADDARRPPPVS